MMTIRELNADELLIASGGGINMGSLAAIPAAPRLLSMFNADGRNKPGHDDCRSCSARVTCCASSVINENHSSSVENVSFQSHGSQQQSRYTLWVYRVERAARRQRAFT